MIEEWKYAKGYEGLYEVSSLGRIRSVDRYVNNNGNDIFKKGKILKPYRKDNGYLQCSLYKNRKHYMPYLHKLIAESFIPNPKELDEVNHINHDKNDCSIKNLEWVTHEENMHKMFDFYDIHKIKKYCVDCGKDIDYQAIRCVECNFIHNRVTERPSKEELYDLLLSNSFSKVGRMYDVTDNTVRKWCKKYEIPDNASFYKKRKI